MKPSIYLLISLISVNLVIAASPTKNPKTVADLGIEMINVGDPKNPEDPSNHYGAVAETFQISKYDTTAAQYCVFLNKVAKHSDPYQLYDERMNSDENVASIVRTGDATTGYTYSVKSPETAQLPIVYLTWFSSARYCNWLNNSVIAGHLLEGSEDASTTEKGAYDFTVPVKVVTSKYTDFLNNMASTESSINPSDSLHKKLFEDEKSLHDIINCTKGDNGKYLYSIKQSNTSADIPDHVELSWTSAARFSNWKYNVETTKNSHHYSKEELTERGLFTIADGIKDNTGDADVVPTDYAKVTPGAKYFLPTENQWYKAAYFARKHYGPGFSSDYYKYPTSIDLAPVNQLETQMVAKTFGFSWMTDDPNDALTTEKVDKGNSANYYIDDMVVDKKFTTGDKKPHLTPVGYFSKTTSPYGVFDMAGNVSQWISGTAGHYVTFSYDEDGKITKSDIAKIDNNGQPLLVDGVTADKTIIDAGGHTMKKDAQDHILLQWQYAGVTRPIRGGGWGNEGQCPTGPEQFEKHTISVIDGSVKRDYIGFRIAAPALATIKDEQMGSSQKALESTTGPKQWW
ncbi:MAG: SUMF1/EgtB/PvdO family nonheme iron enzyme [Verrucomicrobiae bacterium]|jgi:formylglycine-generating enzyme required for sulfatase activity|nr:SUMF1/EgtB/PvdO family nonheme iron enzyme [Verrucomicrobiae bacterium]